MHERLMGLAERWFRLLVRFYPSDFRDDMGEAVVETYRDRARAAAGRRGGLGIIAVCFRALIDTVRNGPGERTHPAVSWRRGGDWGRDIVLARRRLMRSPALVAGVVATLTIGLGLVAVVYTVVHKVLVAPMPYDEPDDLYFVWRDYGPIFDLKRGWLAGTDVAELQKAETVIEQAVGLQRAQVTLAVREGAEPMEVPVMLTSPGLFELLGVAPARGRVFAPDEVGPGRPPLIVLTHELWTRLGADAGIIGKDLRLNGSAYGVIGVMPSTFSFVRHASLGPPQGAEAFITFTTHLAETNPNGGSYAGLVRARPGTPPETVAAVVDAVGRTIDATHFQGQGLRLYPVALKADLVAEVRPALKVIGLAGVFLVLVLTVNLASVLLARAAQREHEVAVSRALGADSAAVMRATLFEGGLLGLLGGAAGTVAAVWGTRTLVALAPLTLPRRESIAVDWQIAGIVISAGLLLGLLAAAAPAIWAARTSLGSLLASSAVRGGGGHGRMRRGLVVVQVALSLVLLTTGALVARSFERLLEADPGFQAGGLLSMRVPIPTSFYPEVADALLVQERIDRALAALPGVTGVTATTALPLTASADQTTIGIPGAPGNTGDPERDRPLVDWFGTRAGYVDVMGIRLVSGRDFDPVRREGVREALIDEQLARQFFPSGSALGATIPFGDQSLTIVGVFRQARLYTVHEDGRPQLQVRAEDGGVRTLSWIVRTSRQPESLIPEVRAAIVAIDPRLAVSEERAMNQIMANAVRQPRLSAVLITAFALGALLLAAMGLFGVVAGSVTRRQHEFAVRLALGAEHRQVLRLVMTDGARLVGLGLLLGAPGIYLAGGLIRGALVGVSPLDPATLAAVALGLGVVAMLACYVPARRVLRLEAAQALRDA